MANLGVVSALVGRKDCLFEDRLNHASLIDAAQMSNAGMKRYAHADTAELKTLLDASAAELKMVISDGVFSMDGDVAPIQQLVNTSKDSGATLMMDDAHGIGVVGKDGKGSVVGQGYTLDDVPLLTGTFGKAFGTFGAFVAASDTVIEFLCQTARSLIYTTAPPAAIASATLKALELVQTEDWRREKLHQNIKQFREGAGQLGLSLKNSETAIQPLLIGDTEKVNHISEQLKQLGFLISAIRTPTVPKGSERLRITLSAAHSADDINKLLSAFEQVL
jgi:8-amino-7-oxononanoate synthase